MDHLAISVLTICGLDELADLSDRKVTHVLSVLDPEWPEVDAFRTYRAHHRTTLRFHDIIGPEPERIPPEPEDLAKILRFGAELARSRDDRTEGHLVVHCHAGVSRSTAAMVCLLAQAFPGERPDHLFTRLRQIRPQAWPNSLMIRHADALLATEGQLLSALGRHYGHQLRKNPHLADVMTRLGRVREVEMAA